MGQEKKTLLPALKYEFDHAKVHRLHTLHLAGLTADHAQLPTLLDIVRNPPDVSLYLTAMRALARIEDTKVLPTVEAAMHEFSDPQAGMYAEVVRAHLLAHQQVLHAQAGADHGQTLLHAFLSALHLSVEELNMGASPPERRGQSHLGFHVSRETWALRELADMIYHKHDLALLQACKHNGINFALDAGARFKADLAPLTQQQRVQHMINELANKKVLKKEDSFLLQLAADEGKPASHAAAAKLMEMDKHRERYALPKVERGNHLYEMGFAALFRVIRAVGDQEQEPVIAHFLNDKEGRISYYAKQAYPNVKSGTAWKWRIGY